MPLSLQRPLVVFDIEATGLSTSKDRIVELSMLKVHPDGREESWTERFNPEMPIPEEAAEIHGIRDADVADKPTFAQRAKAVQAFIEGCDLAGYNVQYFDLPMLVEEFLRADMGYDGPEHCIDAMRIFMKMEPRTLVAALKFYCGKELDDAHSAEADTRATWDVLQGQMQHYGTQLPQDVSELAKFSMDQKFVSRGSRIGAGTFLLRLDAAGRFSGTHQAETAYHMAPHAGPPQKPVLMPV
jgi:DNA polymerase-3 subunit epsilon